jgi:hypothetical protein
MIDSVLEEKAACRDKEIDVNMFYVDGGPIHNQSIKLAISKAVSICKTCPVRFECLTKAVRNKEEFGIWGGLTARERKKFFAPYDEIDDELIRKAIKWKSDMQLR